MFDQVIKKLKDEFPLKEFQTQEDIFYFLYLQGRVILLCNILSNINEIYSFSDKVREFIIDDYQNFKEYLTESDSKQPSIQYIEPYPTLKAFLWDIYIIGIVSDSKIHIPQEDNFMIQRDKYIAQKRVVNEPDVISTLDKIKKILRPEEELNNLLNVNNKLIGEKNIVYYIRNGCMPNGESVEIVGDELWNNLNDIINYINSYKM